MAHVLVRGRRRIDGRDYEAGDVVDVSGLAVGKLASLVRLGILADDPSSEEYTPEVGWEQQVNSMTDLAEMKKLAEAVGVDVSPGEGRERVTKNLLRERLLASLRPTRTAGDEIEEE